MKKNKVENIKVIKNFENNCTNFTEFQMPNLIEREILNDSPFEFIEIKLGVNYELPKNICENYSQNQIDNEDLYIDFISNSNPRLEKREKCSFKENKSNEKNNNKKLFDIMGKKRKRHTKMNNDNIFVKIKSYLYKKLDILINDILSLIKKKKKLNQILYENSKNVQKEFNNKLFRKKLKELFEYKSEKNKKIIKLIEKDKIFDEKEKKILKILKDLLNLKVEEYFDILNEENWLYKFKHKMKLEDWVIKKFNNDSRLNLNVYESIKEKNNNEEYLNKVINIINKIKEKQFYK